MASTRPLLALAVALLIGAPACAATPPATGPPSPATPPAVPVYTVDGAAHRRPTDVEWHAESRTFLVSTYNEGILYRGGLDEPLTPVFLRGQPGQTADGVRIAGGRIYVTAGTEAQIRVYDLATHQRTGTSPSGREIPIHGDSHLTGIVAVSDHRLIVSHRADGLLYRIDLDANGGRAIAPVAGTVVPLATGPALDGNRPVVADFADRGPPPDTVSSVPAIR